MQVDSFARAFDPSSQIDARAGAVRLGRAIPKKETGTPRREAAYQPLKGNAIRKGRASRAHPARPYSSNDFEVPRHLMLRRPNVPEHEE